ncbi:unnamed protein product [Rotaria sordida]|uniref:Uncharacterized protein n=1 Tax=Rotaria sordida TaxID=392033 RepID=A0A819AF37_9BILA|nr:unnamed protein product [Rotaria sordida]
MSTKNSTNKTPWRYRRFWRLFRREKPSLIDITYSYQYMMRFPRLPITVPPLVPTLMSYRCIDSLNSCFQQQKNKTSYDFCLCRGGSGILAKRNDEDDCESIPKKHSYDNHYQQHTRRRLPKRYSDIVGPSSNRVYLPRKDSIKRDKQTIIHSLSQYNHQYTSFKTKSNENLYKINSHNKKSRDLLSSFSKIETKDNSIIRHRYNSKNKRLSTINAVDQLAHRMQAAMSTELMHSLDRNFVFGDKKPLSLSNCSHINRSQSFHTSTSPTNKWWNKSSDKEHYYYVIPRVKHRLDDEQKSIGTISSLDELTPDYDDDDDDNNHNHNHNNIIIRRINNNNNNNDNTDEIDEEPIIDYNDSKLTFNSDIEDKLITPPTLYDLGVTSSFIVQQTSITPSSETFTQEQSSIPPTPPPLPNTTIQQKKLTFRCRTIADKITADHKLILKDDVDTITEVPEEIPIVPQVEEEHSKKSCPITNIISKPCYLHLSKELLEKTTLRKVSYPISRSYSTYGSISQLNDHNTESTTLRGKTSIINEQSLDGLSSSATTSIIIENEYDHRTSSKIYNDYKRRASLITVPTDNTLSHSYSHSAIIHPMHTHIGVRSSTSSSSNDKLNDNNLSNKKMNIRVINQLNEHLSIRFRQQQQDIYLTKDNNIISENIIDHQSYDPPPEQIKDDIQTNVYDEPNHIEITNTSTIKCSDIPTSTIPPPPPPLPVGGFRPIASQLNRPLSSQRTSIITLPRETNGSEFGCSTGTSTISSKLSDARILRELRTNPLFTKAKQHLEIETDLNGRQLNDSKCYLRLDKCSKGISSTIQNDNSNESLNNNNNNNNNNTNMETFIMRPNELNAIMNNTAKRTKSLNSTTKDINQITSRTLTKSFLQTQCRQSELELIFQKRAQRNEQQNPT